MKTILPHLNPEKLHGFTILPDQKIKIPHGVYFSKQADPETGKMAMYADESGIFESVNMLVDAPIPKLDDRGLPKNTNENFRGFSFLFESDTLSLADQLDQARRLVSLGVINKVVFSGGKSYHMRCTVNNEAVGTTERRWLFFHIVDKYNIAGVDPVCFNTARGIRRGGAIRDIEVKRPDGTVTIKPVEQTLIHQNNAILKLNWRPIYNSESELITQHRAQYAKVLGNKRKAMKSDIQRLLGVWENRKNKTLMLQNGLVAMMMYTGSKDNEIRAALGYERCDLHMRALIDRYIRNCKYLGK